jgi:antitoxin HicB
MMVETDIQREVERYMALPYRIELIPDDGEWVVAIPDLPGCLSQGESAEEALEMIREAQRLWLLVALEDGRPVPEPSGAEGEPYNGRFTVRMPKTIHRDLARAAASEGVSLNLFAATALARAVGHDHVPRQPGRQDKAQP